MSSTLPSTAPAIARQAPHLSFVGILLSEVIKLRSLRSTIWCYAIVVVITIAFGLLLSSVLPGQSSDPTAAGDAQQSVAVLIPTLSIGFSQLVACVLGVLVISGEYGTGMIRSTLTAVPTRLPALAAKAIVFGVITLVVSLVSIVGTALLTAPLLPNVGISPDFGDADYWSALVGGALYLTLVSVLALTLGAIVRNSAGGIAAALGLILVVPTVLQIMGGVTQSVAITNIARFLPSEAGGRLYAYATTASVSADGIITLDALQGGLVLLGWVVVFFVIASILLKRCDV